MHETACFDALGYRFRVSTHDATLTAYISELFADLATSAPDGHRYILRPTSDHRDDTRCDVVLDSRLIFRAPTAEQLVPTLVRAVNAEAVERCEPVALHAGGVERDRVGLVFPGRMEAGKTTLVAGLVRGGMGYLTDEAVAIDSETLLIRPYPKPLSLDPGSWGLFPELEPDAPLAGDGYKRDHWQVPSAAIRAGALGRPCPVRLVVFPRYSPGETTALEPLRRAEALVELAKHTFHFKDRSRVALDLLADVIRPSVCYHLTIGDLDGAVALVSSLAGSPTPSCREAS